MRTHYIGFKIWLVLVLFSVSFLIIGYQLGQRLGLFIGLICAIIFHFLIHMNEQSQLMSKLPLRQLKGQDPWGLQKIVQKYSALLGCDEPDLYLFDTDVATAFSLGAPINKGVIGITRGLVDKMSANEIEAIIAHQISHIDRLNTFQFGFCYLFAQMFVSIGDILDRMLAARKNNNKPFQKIFSPITYLLLRIAIKDKTYYENDQQAAAILHDRRTLAEALWKLESQAVQQSLVLPPCSNHFFIVNPLKRSGNNWFLLTHPNIEYRIKNLIGYFPL